MGSAEFDSRPGHFDDMILEKSFQVPSRHSRDGNPNKAFAGIVRRVREVCKVLHRVGRQQM